MTNTKIDSLHANALSHATVPLLDLKAQYTPLRAEILGAIERVCDSQAFILGGEVDELEREMASYTTAKHAIGVSSGTDALLLALMALGVGAGDEVVTSPYTFFATGGTVVRVGARPVFVDIDPVTYNIDAQAIRRFLREQCDMESGTLVNRATGGRVRALMPVHLYGQCADMPALMAIASEYGLHVVEDAAQAIGAEDVDGRRVGSIGDVGCFSFFPSKNLGAFGDAGLCTARDDELADRMRVMRVHGGKPKYYHSIVGGNFRIDALQAAVLRIKLRRLDDWTSGRQRNAEIYRRCLTAAGLSQIVHAPDGPTLGRHIYNQFVVRAPQRDDLRAHLSRAGIGTEVYYPVPLHLQPCFAELGGSAGDCPHAEQAAVETLALPIYPELTEEQICYVVDSMARFYS